MSDEPSNAATEWIRDAFGFLDQLESPPGGIRSTLSDDFVYQDRRRVATFPTCDADSFSELFASFWRAGAAPQRFNLVAVLAPRGDRPAAVTVQTSYGDWMPLEYIEVFELDDTLSLLRRQVDFEADDADGAIAETGSPAQPGDAS